MDEIATVAEAVEPYRESIELLVAGTISPLEFRRRYLEAWRSWEKYISRDVFEVVYPLRSIVTDYCDDVDLREGSDTGPEDLLAGAWSLLAELDREASGVPPKTVDDSDRALPDPARQLEEKIRRNLQTGAVVLYEFQCFHIQGVQFRPWVERCVLFETVATSILESGTARLTWNIDENATIRDADGVDLGLEVWRWPARDEHGHVVEHLALTPLVIEGPPPLTPEQVPMANAWSTLRRLRPKLPRTPEDSAAREKRRSMVKQQDVTVTLTYDEAFALNELFGRWSDEDRISEPRHKGEQVALWAIACVLEPTIAEVFDDDYDVSLRAALDRLAEGIDTLPHLPD